MAMRIKKVYTGRIPFSSFEFNHLLNIVENLSADIVLDAQRQHRFKSRSNNLERSVRNKVKSTSRGITSYFLLDNRIANYGKYIHEGFRSWDPDRFLLKAITHKLKTFKTVLKLKIKQFS